MNYNNNEKIFTKKQPSIFCDVILLSVHISSGLMRCMR